MSESTDRRTLRTKKVLKQALLELLKKQDISKVTVKELSHQADIGRGTFYLHYTDPYDLLDHVMDELLAELSGPYDRIIANWEEDGLLAYLENIWRHVYENKDAFKILMSPRSGTQLMERTRQYCLKGAMSMLHQSQPMDTAAIYNIVYIISGALAIFQRWLEEDTPIPPEELAILMRKLILRD